MEKKFYPDIEFNRKKRRIYFTLLVIGIFLIGGLAISFYAMGQGMLALIVAMLVVLALSTIPSTLMNYPLKPDAIISFEGKTVIFYGKEHLKLNEIVAVSVCIDVPMVSKIKAENEAYLKKVASEKPTEPILGTCDVLFTNPKGKESTKYTIVSDCIGALEALIEMGVKKYRIVYCMKKLSENAQYSIEKTPQESTGELEELSEKERLAQLL